MHQYCRSIVARETRLARREDAKYPDLPGPWPPTLTLAFFPRHRGPSFSTINSPLTSGPVAKSLPQMPVNCHSMTFFRAAVYCLSTGIS